MCYWFLKLYVIDFMWLKYNIGIYVIDFINSWINQWENVEKLQSVNLEDTILAANDNQRRLADRVSQLTSGNFQNSVYYVCYDDTFGSLRKDIWQTT